MAGDLTGNPDSGYEDIETSVAPLVGDVDVYHVSHHASDSSSNPFFLQTVQAEVSVISLGDNSYGHPHQPVLNRLVQYGSFVYQTEIGSGGTLPRHRPAGDRRGTSVIENRWVWMCTRWGRRSVAD